MEINTWVIMPNESVNGIEFGSDRDAIRKIMGKPKRIIKKTMDAVNTIDAYSAYHAYYSADDKLEAIEVFDKGINLILNSELLYPGSLNTAKKILPDLMDENGSYVSKGSSIGIETEENEIESVLIGCKDYYK